jgi:hypothetical protein
VTFTATITPSAAAGTVTFLDGATTLATVRTGPIVGSGRVATFTTSKLVLGPHSITAQFTGNLRAAPSTSAVLTQRVDGKPTSMWLTASPTTATAGQPVQVTIGVVVAPGATPPGPTGVVTVFDGSTPIATAAVGAHFFPRINLTEAFVTLNGLAAGMHFLSAGYSGDGTYAGSTSANVVVVTVGP